MERAPRRWMDHYRAIAYLSTTIYIQRTTNGQENSSLSGNPSAPGTPSHGSHAQPAGNSPLPGDTEPGRVTGRRPACRPVGASRQLSVPSTHAASPPKLGAVVGAAVLLCCQSGKTANQSQRVSLAGVSAGFPTTQCWSPFCKCVECCLLPCLCVRERVCVGKCGRSESQPAIPPIWSIWSSVERSRAGRLPRPL
jgi:hypothetical protein